MNCGFNLIPISSKRVAAPLPKSGDFGAATPSLKITKGDFGGAAAN